jgi:hypothetical protein
MLDGMDCRRRRSLRIVAHCDKSSFTATASIARSAVRSRQCVIVLRSRGRIPLFWNRARAVTRTRVSRTWSALLAPTLSVFEASNRPNEWAPSGFSRSEQRGPLPVCRVCRFIASFHNRTASCILRTIAAFRVTSSQALFHVSRMNFAVRILFGSNIRTCPNRALCAHVCPPARTLAPVSAHRHKTAPTTCPTKLPAAPPCRLS